jgi:hypothetical protein
VEDQTTLGFKDSLQTELGALGRLQERELLTTAAEVIEVLALELLSMVRLSLMEVRAVRILAQEVLVLEVSVAVEPRMMQRLEAGVGLVEPQMLRLTPRTTVRIKLTRTAFGLITVKQPSLLLDLLSIPSLRHQL